MESFYRGKVLKKEKRFMPASLYKKMIVLLKISGKHFVFVPIRSMQYLGVIDKEEIIFVSSHNREVIEFSWREFSHSSNLNINNPVQYKVEHYLLSSTEIEQRIQSELEKSIDLLSGKLSSTNVSYNKIVDLKNN